MARSKFSLQFLTTAMLLSVGTLSAAAVELPPPGSPAAVLCYRLAADPDDPQTSSIYEGVAAGEISHAAVAACMIASQAEPENYQISYLLGRALQDDGNYIGARVAFQSAADQDYPSAERALGDLYWYGRGISRNEADAFDHYARAADLGEPAGLLAAIQRKSATGGTVQDLLGAIEKAGLNGAPEAWTILGKLLVAEPVNPVSREAELALMNGFAVQIVEAGIELGRLYDRQNDRDAASVIFAQLAVAGNAEAMWEMSRHTEGETSDQWMAAAARAGQPEAMYVLAQAFKNGTNGQTADKDSYLSLLDQAAQAENLEAMIEVANLRLAQKPADYASAAALFQKAALRKDVRAYAALARLLEQGYGDVKPNVDKAYNLYTSAIAAGEKEQAHFYRARIEDQPGARYSIHKAAADLMAASGAGPVGDSARAGFREFSRETRSLLQEFLTATGDYTGKIDGVFGPRTIAAFEQHLTKQK